MTTTDVISVVACMIAGAFCYYLGYLQGQLEEGHVHLAYLREAGKRADELHLALVEAVAYDDEGDDGDDEETP